MHEGKNECRFYQCIISYHNIKKADSCKLCFDYRPKRSFENTETSIESNPFFSLFGVLIWTRTAASTMRRSLFAFLVASLFLLKNLAHLTEKKRDREQKKGLSSAWFQQLKTCETSLLLGWGGVLARIVMITKTMQDFYPMPCHLMRISSFSWRN